jgi:hypothetical protein
MKRYHADMIERTRFGYVGDDGVREEARDVDVVLASDHEAEIAQLREVLMELRIRYHAAGRRPEECYEMSLIDDALKEVDR